MGKLWSVKPSDVDGLAIATNNAAPGDDPVTDPDSVVAK